MAKNKAKSVPRLKSIDELVEFFDKHDMGDYWDRLPKATFEVKVQNPKTPGCDRRKNYSQHQPNRKIEESHVCKAHQYVATRKNRNLKAGVIIRSTSTENEI